LSATVADPNALPRHSSRESPSTLTSQVPALPLSYVGIVFGFGLLAALVALVAHAVA